MLKALRHAVVGGFIARGLVNRIAKIGNAEYVSARRHFLSTEEVVYKNAQVVDEILLINAIDLPTALMTKESLVGRKINTDGTTTLNDKFVELESAHTVMVYAGRDHWFEKFHAGDKIALHAVDLIAGTIHWAVQRATQH